MTPKTRHTPDQLVHLGTCQSLSFRPIGGTAGDRKKIGNVVIVTKGHFLTSDTSARALYVLPGTQGKEADPSKARAGLALWSRWSGFTKRSAVAHVLHVPDSTARWAAVGRVGEIFYASDKWHTTGKVKVVEYVHTFKIEPTLYRLGQADIFKISPVRVTSRGIEDSTSRSNPTKRGKVAMKKSRGNPMKKDKASGSGIGPILQHGSVETKHTHPKRGDIRDRAQAMAILKKAVLGYLTQGELREVVRTGADSGWNGFEYYHETMRFYEKYSEAIFKLLEEDADDAGHATIPKLIVSCDRENTIRDYATFANFLAWYALESVARDVADE